VKELQESSSLATARVVAFPKAGIAYVESFYKCVEDQGVPVVEGMFTGEWLWKNLRRGDWVHLHWPSFFYNTSVERWRLLVSFLRWLLLMNLVYIRGGRIIWTVHNLFPHDPASISWLDTLARRLVIAFSKKILVHGQLAAEIVKNRFPASAEKLCLIPHGNWIDYYSHSITREKARATLGLPIDRYIFLFIGACKPYKNLDGLVNTFTASAGDSILFIAGKFPDADYFEQVSAQAANNSRIKINAGFIPDEMMQVYLLACDSVVVPYREILTSGTAMLALSFGRPVVSVDLGFLRDVINPQVGLLYSPAASAGLMEALVAAQHLHFDEDEILEHARKFTFEEAASRFIASLK
jgi:glycosyltransferase involved in cell wall biosynthesis